MSRKVLYGNFYVYEVSKSATAQRLEIDNSASAEVLANAYGLARNVLQPARDYFGRGFGPQSWYRCEKLEHVICKRGFERWCTACGISANAASWQQYFARKQHPTGSAADIEIAGISNDALFEFIRDNLDFDQLIREYAVAGDPYSGWVHVSWLANGNRKDVKHVN